MAERTGLVLPEEARDWLRWQDGPVGADGRFQVGPSLTPRWYLMSLEGAVRGYQDGRELSRQLADDADGEGQWPPSAFPIARGGGHLVVLCDADPVRAPVDVVDTWSHVPGDEPLFASLADMVDLVVRACRLGALAPLRDVPTQLVWTQDQIPPEIAAPDFW